jgi:hypothetical protein
VVDEVVREFPRSPERELLDTLSRRPGSVGMGDEHLCGGSAAFVGRPRVHVLRKSELPEGVCPPGAPVEGNEATPDLEGTMRLPYQARMAGFEVDRGRIIQRVPGLVPPAARRRMLEAEVAEAKAVKLRRKLRGDHERRLRLTRIRHPMGVLGVGGVLGEGIVGGELAEVYGSTREELWRAEELRRHHEQARLAARMHLDSSVARRGYDIVAPDRSDHPHSRLLPAEAASANPVCDVLRSTGDFRSHTLDTSVRSTKTGRPATEDGVRLFETKGRVLPKSYQGETTQERLFPKPVDTADRQALRRQALVDNSSRGRDFDIVTGRERNPAVTPSAHAVATVGAGESIAVVPGSRPGFNSIQRAMHPSRSQLVRFVDK